MDHVIEFWIDDQSYFGGDLYAFRKAPLVLDLSPGEHKIGKPFPPSCFPSHYSCVTEFSSPRTEVLFHDPAVCANL